MILILTCEHAGKEIPKKYSHLFAGAEFELGSHRGFDPGAFNLFSHLQKFAAYDRYAINSRLLVELNRSLHHAQLFSEFTAGLPVEEKEKILSTYYFPFRKSVEDNIRKMIQHGEEVFHLSVHTFTPVFKGQVRNADIGLLYDPKRYQEKILCKYFKQIIHEQDNDLLVRFNYPYKGTADGFTTHLRKLFPKQYRGIEVEVNQRFLKENFMDDRVKKILFQGVFKILKNASMCGKGK